MKKNTFTLLLLLVSIVCFAQTEPEAFIGQLPVTPDNVCTLTSDAKTAYLTKVSELSDKLSDEISRRHAQQKEQSSADMKNIKQANSQAMGMSEADMAKMKTATKAEKQAMAMKAMQQNMQGKTPMAQAGAGNVMAMVQEQQKLAATFSEHESKIQKMYADLEMDNTQAQTLANINKWSAEWSNLGGINTGQGQKMNALAKKIKDAKIAYCGYYSPKLYEILSLQLSYIKNDLPLYKRYEEIEREQAQTASGSAKQNPVGIMALKAIQTYLNKLQNYSIFRYALYDAEKSF